MYVCKFANWVREKDDSLVSDKTQRIYKNSLINSNKIQYLKDYIYKYQHSLGPLLQLAIN